MESIRFNCEKCGVGIKAPTDRAGAKLPCPKCGTQLHVPAHASNAPPRPAPDEAAQFASIAAAASNIAAPSQSKPKSRDRPAPSSPVIAPPIAKPIPPVPESLPRGQQDSPYTPPGAETTLTTEHRSKSDVRIVDIKLPFATVFKFALQLWISMLIIGVAAWLVLMLFFLLLAALGAGVAGFGF